MNFRFGIGSKSKTTTNEETSKPAKSPPLPPSQQPSQAACLIDIPECFESVDVIQVRTASLPQYNVSVDLTDGPVVGGSLGPVDLVQIVKVNESNEELISYHHVVGSDVSSSAAIAAYINSLTYSMERQVGWIRSSNPYRIIRATYCCWNGIGGVDIRVEARIPGGIKAYLVSADGSASRSLLTGNVDRLWAETSLSAMMRAVFLDDLLEISPSLRRLDSCFEGKAGMARLLDALSVILQEWSVNRPPKHWECAVVSAIKRLFFGLGCSLQLHQFIKKQPKLISSPFQPLAIECLFKADLECDGFEALYQLLGRRSGYALPIEHIDSIYAQIKHLLQRTDQPDAAQTAVQLAMTVIKLAPRRLEGWMLLSEARIVNGQFKEALLSLNESPVGRLLPGGTINHPIIPDMPYKRAHLPCLDDGLVDITGPMADEDAGSVDVMLQALKAPLLQEPFDRLYGLLVKIYQQTGWDKLLQLRASLFLLEHELERDDKEHISAFENVYGKDPSRSPSVSITSPLSAPKHSFTITTPSSGDVLDESTKKDPSKEKRLCERWLDSLFLMLYEDLRIYTIYKADLDHHLAHDMFYHRTPREWLIIGSLCRRLGQKVDAKEAFLKCVDLGYSGEAWGELLKGYVEEARLSHALNAAARIVHYSLNYHQPTPPLFVIYAIAKLLSIYGVERIKDTLDALNFGPALSECLRDLVEQLVRVGSDGSTKEIPDDKEKEVLLSTN